MSGKPLTFCSQSNLKNKEIANICTVSTLIGTSPNAIFASLADSIVGLEVTFGQWMLLGLPISALSLIMLWFKSNKNWFENYKFQI
jgi:di/tricarboxylate transporter